MFVAHLADGTVVDGLKTAWHDMPRHSLVTKLGCQLFQAGPEGTVQVADDMLSGFDSYGFQKYQLHTTDGVAGEGVQLIGIKDGGFVTIDINLVSGARRYSWQELDKLTYNRALLRSGTSRVAG